MSTHSRETIAKNRAKMKHFLRKKNCCLSPPCSARFSQLFGGRDRFDLQWRRAALALYHFATIARRVKKCIQGARKTYHFRSVAAGTLRDASCTF